MSCAIGVENDVGWKLGRYNLVVVGAGAAGLVSAAGAAGVGARVAIIEKELMGGDCLNVGCVPSKALIRCARSVHEVSAVWLLFWLCFGIYLIARYWNVNCTAGEE